MIPDELFVIPAARVAFRSEVTYFLEMGGASRPGKAVGLALLERRLTSDADRDQLWIGPWTLNVVQTGDCAVRPKGGSSITTHRRPPQVTTEFGRASKRLPRTAFHRDGGYVRTCVQGRRISCVGNVRTADGCYMVLMSVLMVKRHRIFPRSVPSLRGSSICHRATVALCTRGRAFAF